MTTLYTDYTDAYDAYMQAISNGVTDLTGYLNLSDVNLGVILVDNTYVPDPSHKPWEITGYILAAPNALWEDVIETQGMSEIVSRLKARLKAYAERNPSEIAEAYRMEFNEPSEGMNNVWQKLIDKGAKYLIIYSTPLQICCFAEEITAI